MEEIETAGAGPRIENEADFAKWLEEARPAPDVCVALSARAALRALPFILEDESNSHSDQALSTIASGIFRTCATSWVAARYSSHEEGYGIDIVAAITSIIAKNSFINSKKSAQVWAAANAALTALRYKISMKSSKFDASKFYSNVLHAVEISTAGILLDVARRIGVSVSAEGTQTDNKNSFLVFNKFNRAEDHIWYTIEKDVYLIYSEESAEKITASKLWYEETPVFVSKRWGSFKDYLPDSDNWWVWKNWYEDILNGRARSEAHDMIYATVPEEEWDKGPAAANAWIAAKLAELEGKTSTYALNDFPEVVAQENQATHEKDGPVDFFISYEKEDVGFARFVDSVLRKAGYRVFVQFRDMPTGSDFLVEMNKGLSQASRFIAILSPRYNKSKMCQAEWNAAYHLDPDGKKRIIVQYLIEATDLIPLARSRVYKSLVGLSQAQATEAILDAVGSKACVDTDATWPGAEALDHMSQATKPLFDVALDDKRQLAPVANHSLNQETERLYGFSAENLYMDMREAIQDYTEYVCDTREGNFAFSSSIQHTASKLLEKTHEDWKKSNPLAINRALIHTLMALENADRNGDLPSGDINYHQNELRGMHQRLIQIFPNLEQFREKARFERYVEPELKALEAQTDILLKTAADSIVTSPKLANILRDSQASLDELRELLLPETTKETRRKDLYEEHKSIATQIVPVWNWIVNAGAKISKTGDDMSKTIENFEKLSKRIDNARDYFDWLSKWFY